jgi:hypothetical protein
MELDQSTQHWALIVPDRGAGRCLGPEGNGVSLGKGGEGGPGPPRK